MSPTNQEPATIAMHAEYPAKSTFVSWEELAQLARALAFPASLFHARATTEQRACQGLRLGEVQIMLEEGTFIQELNKTYNVHDGSYNTKVLSKSLELLCSRQLSFSALKLARVTFQTYEHSDHAGIQDHLLLRALKLCGKVVAPLRVQHKLRHMNRLVADRVMFYELLAIIVECDDLELVTSDLKRDNRLELTKDSTGLYELCDFEEELITEDERIQRRLNEQYQESLRIIAVKSSTNKIGQSENSVQRTGEEYKKWVKPPLADADPRKRLAEQNKMQAAALGNYLQSSDMVVRRCQCGDKCSCVSSLPPGGALDEGQIHGGGLQGLDAPRTSLDAARRRDIKWLVTERDIDDTVRAKEDIEWSMATKRHLQKQKLAKQRSHLDRPQHVSSHLERPHHVSSHLERPHHVSSHLEGSQHAAQTTDMTSRIGLDKVDTDGSPNRSVVESN